MMTVEESNIDDATQVNYKTWKKNSKHLYDYIQTSALTWPSLTLQWLPDVEKVEGLTKSRLLLGSFSSGLAEEQLIMLNFMKDASPRSRLNPQKYDSIKEEFVITASSGLKPINVQQRISHSGEVNRARSMPQNPDLIATITSNGDINVFDRTKHPSQPTKFQSEIELTYHSKEGFGLSWNPRKEAQLVSCASDGKVAYWDLNRWVRGTSMSPSTTISESVGLNDVKHLPIHDSIIGYVGEESVFKMHDTRNDETISLGRESHSEINCLSFNTGNDYCVATGDSDGMIDIWDIRTRKAFKEFKAHDEDITCLEWNWSNHGILASGSGDKTCKIWDFANEDDDQLLFVHGGHMAGITDLGWSPDEQWMLGTVAYDNSVHVWQPSTALV
ncbi:unnamed protein product [Kuraishia capsulata CBS 1993]|uniref:Histone-binding protein RBBP4-like N-terminal domain-containing protein n=1 Tax=Kuraishia capsulata CBS 1993 TaxID=1382522 RepID=W6MWS6_9ASCO|nr:uncharacterized protein KUCA_T00003789001 [Kuraishia capsulata CBS 1993]CDK27810.1 unnamed protein product [Kuraishia capsulata CBS 1993]